MYDAGLHGVLGKSLQRIESSRGVGDWVWGGVAVADPVARFDDFDYDDYEDYLRLHPQLQHQQHPQYLQHLVPGTRSVQPPLQFSHDLQTKEPIVSTPISELIQQLEMHRKPLLALAGKVQFSVTLEKVNMLCDGISYLLLQQVVGIN